MARVYEIKQVVPPDVAPLQPDEPNGFLIRLHRDEAVLLRNILETHTPYGGWKKQFIDFLSEHLPEE